MILEKSSLRTSSALYLQKCGYIVFYDTFRSPTYKIDNISEVFG